MIKVENIKVFNFQGAIRGMRNPMNSWERSDSGEVHCEYMDCCDCIYCIDGACDEYKSEVGYYIGKNDLGLMRQLYKAGNAHAKYLRSIIVNMDITCHHVWWAEFDTYVFTVRNSCSKMHKIHVKPFEKEDFSHEGIDEVGGDVAVTFEDVLCTLEILRQKFNETNEKKYWRAIIELLPMGYNIRATITTNYQTIMDILKWRQNHKVEEWRTFCKILRELPYIDAIRGEDK